MNIVPFSPESRGQVRGAYSIGEAAKWLGVSAITIRRLIWSGRLYAVRCGRRILIPEQSMLEYIKSLPRAI